MIFTYVLLAATFFTSPAIASCGHGLDFIQPFEARDTESTPFNYGVTTGPLNWHNLNKTYVLCGNGKNQSPILLDSSSALAPAGSIKLNIPVAHDATFMNTGTTVEVVINGTLEAAGTKWQLKQFHFHTPSEHRVDFGHADAEMHLVFGATDGSTKATVLAFFVKASSETSTPVLETVFSHLGDIQTQGTSTTVPEVDFTSFQKHANLLKYYHYTGSLTTPPCTEGVSWFLATTPILLQVETYNRLKDVTKTNNRYTQNTPGAENILDIAAAGL